MTMNENKYPRCSAIFPKKYLKPSSRVVPVSPCGDTCNGLGIGSGEILPEESDAGIGFPEEDEGTSLGVPTRSVWAE